MATRFYIMPVDTITGADGMPTRGPSHLAWYQETIGGPWVPAGGIVCQWSGKDYGMVDRMVMAVNADTITLDTIAAFADVLALPENLNATPNTSVRNTIKSRLEGFNIPSGWIVAGMTYRTILRTVLGMFMFMQRLCTRSGNPFTWGINLDTVFSSLSAERQQFIRDAANSLGYPGDNIPAAWTIRQILKYAADQWADTPILFGFVTV